MPNPITYTEAQFTTSSGAVDAEQLRQEFVAANFPSTPVVFSHVDVNPPGSSPRALAHFDTVPNATDEATALAVVNAHDATGPENFDLTLAFAEMNGNSVLTTIGATDTYQALDVTGLVSNPITQRFELTDAVAGVYTYTGLLPVSGNIGTS